MTRSENPPETHIPVGLGIVLRESILDRPNGGGENGDEPRILVTRRTDGALFAGYWEFPGGKVEEGEPIEDCVVREVREEVGIGVRVIHNLCPVTHTYPHGTVRLHPSICVREDPIAEPRSIEVAETRWCRLDEFASLRFLPANESILVNLREYLEG